MELKGGPTQDEVMAISLFKLGLKNGDILADVGCGTGKVSIEAAKICSKVFAIDKRKEAIDCASGAIKESGVKNVDLISGEASEILKEIDYLDCAFLGGSANVENNLEILSGIVKGKIVINAVLLGTVQKSVEKMKSLGIFEEIIQVHVARSYSLCGDIMFKPINPVYIIVGSVNR
ncbi:precorrin-6Y C5,15-methyltransferase (decarboxylating) subunit CbiT [Methanoplanus sp. FWC-SCC4]|uniref:Precorrin-6Y C5,15-methyltransferase (Decarboxylating) subunit CbiT n=1 Tax=Methanochimaera problematica TaxID=2609417 RepID=A0AA97FC61_9EURY|nr:precorrin-6Y C5,15-methyltransferase (decarboxylating) subunit CbiT [Methanoplanus sp. FWC-SCC4]WOF15827.1 precorrin-6Y C5,15-methyltransferase (decarboxylating) subunit CbiT [Methanoplanus sp. FWC-SCC4]